jgi:hypothetical protein
VQASSTPARIRKEVEKMNKTNKNWYPYQQDGNYYRLVDGVLISSPMNADGSRDSEEVEVDFDMLAFEKVNYQKDGKIMSTVQYLRAIEEELMSKE